MPLDVKGLIFILLKRTHVLGEQSMYVIGKGKLIYVVFAANIHMNIFFHLSQILHITYKYLHPPNLCHRQSLRLISC